MSDLATNAQRVQQVLDDLFTNADYAEADSLAKGQAFVTAARRAVVMRPQRSGNDEAEVWFDLRTLKDDLATAEKWVQNKKRRDARSTGNGGFIQHQSVDCRTRF